MPRVSKSTKEESMNESINYINMASDENMKSVNNPMMISPVDLSNTGGITDEYSEYVKLPVSGYEAHVRGLKIKEEDMLRSNTSTPKNMYDALHEIIFKCTRFVPINGEDYGPFKNVDDMKRKMCMADRDALVWALISQTYGNSHGIYITCQNCGKSFETTFDISKSMTINGYNGTEPYVDKIETFEIPELKWKFYFKLPKLIDEERGLKQNEANKKLINASLYAFIDKLETTTDVISDSGMKIKNTTNVYTTPVEIYSIICEQPVKYKDLIFETYFKKFPYYGTDVNLEVTCPSCDNEINQNMNACPHMFRMVERLY